MLPIFRTFFYLCLGKAGSKHGGGSLASHVAARVLSVRTGNAVTILEHHQFSCQRQESLNSDIKSNPMEACVEGLQEGFSGSTRSSKTEGRYESRV